MSEHSLHLSNSVFRLREKRNFAPFHGREKHFNDGLRSFDQNHRERHAKTSGSGRVSNGARKRNEKKEGGVPNTKASAEKNGQSDAFQKVSGARDQELTRTKKVLK